MNTESNSNVLPSPLRGIIPPMVTPLLDRDSLDITGLERLIEHILGGGVHGLFILGTTGEGPSLSYRLRYELIERVCGGANLFPKLYVDLYNAACSKDLPTVEALHKKVMQIRNAIYSVGQYESRYLKGIKCSLSCMGICSDFLAEPFRLFRGEERDLIRRHIKELRIV